ncbi:hypothetical protein [Sphingopyxis granuli]|uniref:hypothetical protein n=1 Tax=Sphingopyxis granuli TaxID=267128 RepID=UPI00301DB465
MRLSPLDLVMIPIFLALATATPAESSSPSAAETSDNLLAAIKPGMTEAEIAATLGTPKGRAPTPWGDIIVTWDIPSSSGTRQVRYVFGADGKMLRIVPAAKPS